MANKQINELTELTSLASGDLLVAYDVDEAGSEKTKKITHANAQVPYVLLVDEKSSGSAGGTFNSGSWVSRAIATERSDDHNICSESANQITLAAGKYRCKIQCPAYAVANHKTRLRNVTDGTTLVIGGSAYANTSGTNNLSFIIGEFTIAAAKLIEIQHRCQTSGSGNGFGNAVSFDENEIFTIAEFWKVG